MERFEICVPSPHAPLVIVVIVVPAEDAGWLEATIRGAIWEGQDPYKLLKWLPDYLAGYADEVEIWPDLAAWRHERDGSPVNVTAYRAVVTQGR